MNAAKAFFTGMLTMLILAIVGCAVFIIFTNGRSLDNTNLVNSVPITQPNQVTATPGVAITIIDDGNEPVIKNLVPTAAPTLQATATPTAVPEAVIDYAEDVLARPTRDYNLTNDQLAACLQAQQTGRRLAPYCPPNPAEYAGQGR